MTSKPMTLEDLEAQVARTQGRGRRDSYCVPKRLVQSLLEEAKEVADLLTYDSIEGPEVFTEDLKLELGDVLNVTVATIMHAGFTLREVAEANDAKMRQRMPEGCGE